MKKILKNKKLLLIILAVILLLVLLSTYIKTGEKELALLFEQENKVSKKELLFETDQKNTGSKLKEEKIVQEKVPIENKKKVKTKTEADRKIESIALIKEIKDPFQREAGQKENKEAFAEKTSHSKKSELKSKNNLIYLERNIIAENIIDKTQNRASSSDSVIKINKKSSFAAEVSETNNKNRNSISEQGFKSIRLPFKLLGIIKNKDNSSALFLYQGQNILKKEKEKIDVFMIEEINNNNLTISYQKVKRKLHLWKEKNNEK